jgi:serine/threonine protein kinase
MDNSLIGKELLGQFRIVERIGRGGMGEVYKAEQPAMDRLVAIKILHSKLASRTDLVSRFRREARAMSRLSHPNTARVFLYGQLEETGQLYIVMEYLDGSDLARLVRKDGPLELSRGINVMIQVLGALEEAHSVGIVHRDLKPENILLTTQGGITDFPKVLDFGLAKIHENKPRPGSMVLTMEGMVFGTPEFMSPEQARGEILDFRTDIYSLALIFYELVTGKLPFPKCKPMEYISHHIYSKPMAISRVAPQLNLPASLDPIIATALAKDKKDRYASARDFAESLKSLRTTKTDTISRRALQTIPAEKGESTQKTATQKPAPKARKPAPKPAPAPASVSAPTREPASGRGLLVALVVLIVVLLAIVIWLVSTRNQPVENANPQAATGLLTDTAPADARDRIPGN